MRKIKFLALGFAALMMAACSSDDLAVADGGGTDVVGEGKAFVSLNIAIPTTGGSQGVNHKANRASTDYNDGTEDEFKVSDITVLVFDNGTGKLERVYSSLDHTLAEPVWSEPKTFQITRQAILPAFAVEDNHEKDLFVLLNYTDLTQLKAIAHRSELDELILTKNASEYSKQDNFLMCNATLREFKDNDTSVKTFVKVQPFRTAEQAKNNRENIFVERLVSKVTLTNAATEAWGNSTWTYTVPNAVLGGTVPGNIDPSYAAGSKITILGWNLDITNNSSYLVRRVEGGWLSDGFKYKGDLNRFYDVDMLPAVSPSNLFRINYAIDPNYTSFEEGDFNLVKNIADQENMGKPVYCYENTFDVANQKQDRTTRLLIKAQYVPQGFEDGASWFTIGASEQPRNGVDLTNIIKNALVKKLGEKTITVNTTNMSGINNYEGNVTINGNNINADQIEYLKAEIGDVKAYQKGICYYVVRIKHFGDAETPWGANTGAPVIDGTTYYKYADASVNKEYLGRYGVVRNNWYEVSLNTISGPGTPMIPEPTSEIDDEHSYYISARINILSWRLRKQSVDL